MAYGSAISSGLMQQAQVCPQSSSRQLPVSLMATAVPLGDSPQTVRIAATVTATAVQIPMCTAAAGGDGSLQAKAPQESSSVLQSCGPSASDSQRPPPGTGTARAAACREIPQHGLECRRRRCCLACGNAKAAAPAQWRTDSFRITWQRSCAASQNVRLWLVHACTNLHCWSPRTLVLGSPSGVSYKHSSHGW